MTEVKPRSTADNWISPSTERLISKITYLEEALGGIPEARKLEQARLLESCENYLGKARGYLNRRSLGPKFPFFRSKHPHLVWEFLHRVDENLILVMNSDELPSRAIEVKTSFDLTITEPKIRDEWIGPKGKLVTILEGVQAGKPLDDTHRPVIRDALRLVNEQTDRSFWQLSMNTLTSVWSAALLGLVMVAWILLFSDGCDLLAKRILSGRTLTFLMGLGIMGAYLSNLLTKENFLYVRGAPFGRYWLHNLFAKPLMSGFAAVFVYLIERSHLVFAIQQANNTAADTAGPLLIINVGSANVGFVYAAMAIVSGFAADKLLKDMIDSVLKRMEQEAEKTKDSKGQRKG